MTLFKLFIVSIVITIAKSQNFTCENLLDISDNKKSVSLPKLKTMQRKDIITCLVRLGKEPLRSLEADYIWHSIKIFYGDVANIPESILATLQWVTPAIPAEEYYNITLGSIDVIENFGKDYGLNENQLTAVAERVRHDFKEPEDYTFYDLIALKQILCAFNGSEIARIHAKAYKAAFVEIGELKRCSTDVLQAFFKLATDSSAFGPPDYWDNAVLSSIGALGEFLPKNIQDKISKAKREMKQSLRT
ncbi:uncharacterized protein LOC123718853 [Pieris brassicae]|uniref:uncharacterized protein LOC123718853 n=1 Tax=Pieris brassicae TaxID=7116 RepID=UPI001E661930|nr:uncharacterized protein LOC123718853 [Pieris brassicae]